MAIVGGGAAGLAAAIFAARANPTATVVVLDGARTLGAKILVSGGGRCNVTNRHVAASDFNGGSAHTIARVLRAFPAEATVAFFKELGVPLHEEAHGKLFPDANRARPVLDALLRECLNRAVAIRTGCRVLAVKPEGAAFVLKGPSIHLAARRVILATGGLALPKSGSDGHGLTMARELGHTIVPTTPALVPLQLDDDQHVRLAGVSHAAILQLRTASGRPRSFHGSLLWTHVGVSGPVVLDASRHWLRAALEGADPALSLRVLAGDFPALDAWLVDGARQRPRAQVSTLLAERLPAQLAAELVALAGSGSTLLSSFERDARRALVHVLTDLPLAVTGSRGYTHAEATAGGVSLTEIDPKTMASRVCPGLFLVGEVLDVDGRLGGFNFQWAWSSACVAGQAAARSIA